MEGREGREATYSSRKRPSEVSDLVLVPSRLGLVVRLRRDVVAPRREEDLRAEAVESAPRGKEGKRRETYEVISERLPQLSHERRLGLLDALVRLELPKPRRVGKVVLSPEEHATLARRERKQREVVRLDELEIDSRRVNSDAFDPRDGRRVLGSVDECEGGGDGAAELVAANLVAVAEVRKPGEVAARTPLLEELVDDALRPAGRSLGFDFGGAEETLGEEGVGDEETETETGSECLCE